MFVAETFTDGLHKMYTKRRNIILKDITQEKHRKKRLIFTCFLSKLT